MTPDAQKELSHETLRLNNAAFAAYDFVDDLFAAVQSSGHAVTQFLDQAPNGRTAKQPLSARGVVDMYRLALSKRRTVPRKKPSWRSPSSSLIFGKAGGNNAKGNDSERPSPGFLTPLSPTLAEFKIRLKYRNGKKKAVAKKSPTPGASTPAQASGNESSDESGILYSGGATPARYASSKSVSSKTS